MARWGHLSGWTTKTSFCRQFPYTKISIKTTDTPGRVVRKWVHQQSHSWLAEKKQPKQNLTSTMKKLILPLLLALASSLPLSAAQYLTWSQTNSYSMSAASAGTLVFNQFDALPAGWTVAQVQITANLDVSEFSYSVTNKSATVAKVESYYTGAKNDMVVIPVSQYFPLVATNGTNYSYPYLSVAAYESVVFVGTSPSTSHTWTYADSSSISNFVGSGTYGVSYDVSTAANAAVSGTSYGVDSVFGAAAGNVITTFFYSVPEPSTYAMIGGSVLMLLALKRRGKDA